MSVSTMAAAATIDRLEMARRGRRRARLRRLRTIAPALFILGLVVVVGITAPWIAPHDPGDVSLRDRLLPPGSPGYPLGTDALGQDILSRVIFGARISLIVGFSAVAISGLEGVVLGLLAGYYGKWADDIIMRVADVQLAFPVIILYIAVMAVLGPGLLNLIVVMGVVGWVHYCRVERSMVLAVRSLDYVDSARSVGGRDGRILLRHILPNTLGPITVVASFGLATTIINEAALSFLGLGVPPSVPSWGSMLADGRNYLATGWWVSTIPGIAITVTVLAINQIGDWLRDELDPLVSTRL